jgi:hypothetical protein
MWIYTSTPPHKGTDVNDAFTKGPDVNGTFTKCADVNGTSTKCADVNSTFTKGPDVYATHPFPTCVISCQLWATLQQSIYFPRQLM